MGRLNKKSSMKGVTGLVGQVVLREVRGETIISNRPAKRKGPTKNQKPAIRRFTLAQRHAKLRLKDPAVKAMYLQGVTPKKPSAHAVAAADFLNPPIVHYIKAPDYDGAVGAVVTIKATDDFRVASVAISITDGDGTILETGAATPYRLKPFIWKYKTAVPNKAPLGTLVKATAKDFAGNETTLVWTVKQ